MSAHWWLGLLLALPACGQPLLHLKARRPGTTLLDRANAAAPKKLNLGRSHLVVQFSRAPEAGQIRELEARGARVLEYVPDDGVLVAGGADLNLDGLGVHWSGTLTTEEKLGALGNLVVGEDGLAIFVLEFYPDVEPAQARSITLLEGLEILEHPDLAARHLLARGTPAQAAAVAGWDEVAYVFPASSDLAQGRPVVACAGAWTEFGSVGQYVARVGHGWDGPGRGAASLGYYFGQLSEKLPTETARSELRRAFQEWARHARLSFTEASGAGGEKTIDVLFGRGSHGDRYPFDGRGRTLAHTFYPAPPNPESLAGDMHFDDDEDWRQGADTDLFSVALHETGHALGLGHSDSPAAVMYPYYRRATALAGEDIGALLELYAARDGASPNPSPPPAPPPTPPSQPPSGADTTPPTVTITSPASANVLTAAAAITLRGSARDNVRVTEVTWSSSAGGSGTATGTANWVIADLPLLVGVNTITVRARDAAGNQGWRTVMVTRRRKIAQTSVPQTQPTSPHERPPSKNRSDLCAPEPAHFTPRAPPSAGTAV